jgi:hypothetical protein
MQKITALVAFTCIAALSACDSGGKDKVKEPVGSVAQTIKNDSVITVFHGVEPCDGCKAINTDITFQRSVNDTVGRFHLSESYINKKDSAFQHYEGVGDYKIIPTSNGKDKGIAFYDMVVADASHHYVYLLEDSVTMVRVDENGKPYQGDGARVLKKSSRM